MTCSEVWALHKWHATNSSCFKMPLFSSHIVPQGAIKSSLKIFKNHNETNFTNNFFIFLFYFNLSDSLNFWQHREIDGITTSTRRHSASGKSQSEKNKFKNIKILILKSYISAPNCRSGRVDPHFPTSTVPEIALEPLDSDPHLGGFLRMWRMNRG